MPPYIFNADEDDEDQVSLDDPRSCQCPTHREVRTANRCPTIAAATQEDMVCDWCRLNCNKVVIKSDRPAPVR